MRCSMCEKRAVFHDRALGYLLCSEHLREEIWNRFLANSRDISINSRIAVALSGGKDSSTLLYLISQRFEDVIAITIDEGISPYRDECIEAASDLTRELGVEHIIASFEDILGFRVDDPLEVEGLSRCTICGVPRRWLLNRIAREIGADLLATGHNMDDELQSALISFAHGDDRRLRKWKIKTKRIHPKLVPRFKPLRSLPERIIGVFALVEDIPHSRGECPYSGSSFRSLIRDALNRIEGRSPGLKPNLFKSLEAFLEDLEEIARVRECSICGEPSSREVCSFCELRRSLGA